MRFAKENEHPVVSVCLITYNHKRWIQQALDSVIMQETDFPCEFIIADDGSTDGTRELLLEYADKYPLKLILQENNVGVANNWRDLMKAPKGTYIGYLEGDDAWEDPLKLKKQLTLLEDNKDIAVCYSNAHIYDTLNPDLTIYFSENKKPPVRLNKYEVISHSVIPTCTLFFRNKMNEIPDWLYTSNGGDYFLVYLLSKYGDIVYQDEFFGIYNHHYAGISAKRNIGKATYEDVQLNYKLLDFLGHDRRLTSILIGRHVGDTNYIFHRRYFKLAIRLFWKLPFFKIISRPGLYITIIKQGIKVHFLFFLSKDLKTAV